MKIDLDKEISREEFKEIIEVFFKMKGNRILRRNYTLCEWLILMSTVMYTSTFKGDDSE